MALFLPSLATYSAGMARTPALDHYKTRQLLSQPEASDREAVWGIH
jgi:hypothetical protein